MGKAVVEEAAVLLADAPFVSVLIEHQQPVIC